MMMLLLIIKIMKVSNSTNLYNQNMSFFKKYLKLINSNKYIYQRS